MLKTGRTLAMTLAAWSCGLATTCVAQTYATGGDVMLPAYASGYDHSSGAFGDSGPAYGGVESADYGGMPANCPPQTAYGAACEPQPACWWKRPLLISPRLLKPPRSAYFRMEYLLWTIDKPGNVVLGSPLPSNFGGQLPSGLSEPDFSNTLFDVDFNRNDGFLTANANGTVGGIYVPSLEEIQLRDNSGIRGTIGIPTYDYGTIELSAFLLEQATDHYRFTSRSLIPPANPVLAGIPFLPATPFSVNGNNANFKTRNYNQALEVVYKSDVWGADAKYVVDSLSPDGEGLKLKPLFGVKYVGFDESMFQQGSSQSTTLGAFNSVILSDTHNSIFGGTVGLRTELVHRWFTLGVQPAVTFAGNASKTSVVTDRFASPTESRRQTTSHHFDFSSILDLNAYARICLTDNLRMTVGYDAFWLSRVYRPAHVIDYNVATDASGTSRADFDTKKETDDVTVQGLSLGLEYIF